MAPDRLPHLPPRTDNLHITHGPSKVCQFWITIIDWPGSITTQDNHKPSEMPYISIFTITFENMLWSPQKFNFVYFVSKFPKLQHHPWILVGSRKRESFRVPSAGYSFKFSSLPYLSLVSMPALSLQTVLTFSMPCKLLSKAREDALGKRNGYK